jgi:hypothetical protein
MRLTAIVLLALLASLPTAAANHQAYWEDSGTAGGDPHFCMAWGMPPASVNNAVSGAQCWTTYCIENGAAPLLDSALDCALDSGDVVTLVVWTPEWAYYRFVDDGAATVWNGGLVHVGLGQYATVPSVGALLCHSVWTFTCGVRDPVGPYPLPLA